VQERWLAGGRELLGGREGDVHLVADAGHLDNGMEWRG